MRGKYDPVNDYRAIHGGFNDEFPPAPHSIADTLDELKRLYPETVGKSEDDGLDEMCGGGNVRVHETGAKRSRDADAVRYELISPVGLERIAKTYAEGAARYGDHNWLYGFPVHDLLNHAIRHQYLYLSGDRSEDHLAHAAWGLFTAMHSEQKWPHLNAGHLRGPGCTPPQSPITEVEF